MPLAWMFKASHERCKQGKHRSCCSFRFRGGVPISTQIEVAYKRFCMHTDQQIILDVKTLVAVDGQLQLLQLLTPTPLPAQFAPQPPYSHKAEFIWNIMVLKQSLPLRLLALSSARWPRRELPSPPVRRLQISSLEPFRAENRCVCLATDAQTKRLKKAGVNSCWVSAVLSLRRWGVPCIYRYLFVLLRNCIPFCDACKTKIVEAQPTYESIISIISLFPVGRGMETTRRYESA